MSDPTRFTAPWVACGHGPELERLRAEVAKLEDHGPEGRNVTNAQFLAERAAREAAEKELADYRELKRNKCATHQGARVVCGQCHDSNLQHLSNERSRAEQAEQRAKTNEIAALANEARAENLAQQVDALKAELEEMTDIAAKDAGDAARYLAERDEWKRDHDAEHAALEQAIRERDELAKKLEIRSAQCRAAEQVAQIHETTCAASEAKR
jgi:hypothetical protein